MELDKLDDIHRTVAEQTRAAIRALACGSEAVASTVNIMASSVDEVSRTEAASSYETIPQAS